MALIVKFYSKKQKQKTKTVNKILGQKSVVDKK